MAKIKNPLLAFSAVGRLGKNLALRHSRGVDIIEQKPETPNMKTPAQLEWRHMYQKATALWNALSPTEKQEWETLARPKHMPGFAYFISLALKPNPGLYLPLQGGTMQGNIDMNSFRLLALIDPTLNQEPVTKKYFQDHLPAGGYTQGACLYHSAHQTIPTATYTYLAWDSQTYDVGDMHNPITNNSRIKAPTTGKYLAGCVIVWQAHSTGFRRAGLNKNHLADFFISYENTLGATYSVTNIVVGPLDLATNDYVEVLVLHNTGGNLLVYGGAYNSRFWMQRIG